MENHDLDQLRHSAAHLLAKAVLEIWPEAKNAIGPAIEQGFYQDFDFGDIKVSDEDLPRIEQKMREIVKSWGNFEGKEVSVEEAKEMFAHNLYKLELIDDIAQRGEKITVNNPGNFLDLCGKGHIESPKENLKHFKLLSVAGAYWKGDEKNKMLTRIYGTAFPSKEELEAHLVMMEEAKKRDHKKLGKDLDLFVFSDLVGKGLPLWTPKGSIIRRELERFIVDEELKRGYLHVYSPDIAKLELYKTSGHYPYYKDSMYAPIKIEDEEFMLRPMTCPHHFELFKSKPHSYRELPMRLAELAKLYRFEQSGELTGLIRVRSFCLADAHIIARKDQAESEINKVLDLIEFVSNMLGFEANKDYWYRLSLGDRSDEKKYYKDDAAWDEAENALRNVLKQRDVKSYEAPNEAAFYGPKLDIQMRNVNGKEDTAFTVQYDFVMPKRFQLKYIDENGAEVEPIVVHRSSIGAIERIIAFLIERYAGSFPLWLSPVQVKLIPISENHNEFARQVLEKLLAANIRAEIDDRPDRMQKKIREAQLEKVNYMAVIGDKEIEANSVAVRKRSGEDGGVQKVEEFVAMLKKEIEDKIIA